ncbi:MAG: C40 family peptidase [Armatimonadetes bacterium]|nr:C40 family peptidase [Armatimonadota bacterium]
MRFFYPTTRLQKGLLISSLLLCPIVQARADQTLTIPLPSSRAAQEQQAQQKAQQPPASKPTRQRTALTSRGQGERGGGRDRIVGTLGLLIQDAPIYRGRGTSTRLLSRSKSGTYLALQVSEGDWFGVLMADSSIGWVSKDCIRTLDYNVVSTQANPALNMNNIGGGAETADVYPFSAEPYFRGDAQLLLQEAYKYLGVRYQWGGNTYDGIDCSGFLKKVFATQGYHMPRVSGDQIANGVPVSPDQLQAGDRLYFGRRRITHTGLYIGDGRFIHASSSNHGVAVSSLSEAFYARIYVGARR